MAASPTSTPLMFPPPILTDQQPSMDSFTSFPMTVQAENCRWSTSPSAYNSSGSSGSPFDDQSLSSVCDSVTSADPFDFQPFDLKTESNDEDNIERKLNAPPMKVASNNAEAVNVKRRRGRPRKHPIVVPSQDNKSVKGRSKTGCITCRRRKKKCDETRPSCLNCQKNNAICEGYRLPEHWQSGRSRAGDKGKKPRDLPTLINGVETDIDRMLLDHFNCNLSQKLCLCGDSRSPFNDLIIPMALRDSGLMHSVLSLSGFHFAAVNQHHMPDNVRPEIIERRHYHFDKAISLLREKNMARSHTCDQKNLTDDPTVAQTVMLCLTTTMAGDHFGEYQMHLDAARHLVTCQPSTNPDFQNFLTEIVVYLDVVNSITSLDRRSILSSPSAPKIRTPTTPDASSHLGVQDLLFLSIAKVTTLRDKVRARRVQALWPVVDFQTLLDAQSIDAELRDWICPHKDPSPRYTASLLYRVCTWIYLHRTILPSAPDQNLADAVDEGLDYLRRLAPSDNNQAVLLMPVFLLGCAAFEPRQRPQVMAAFDTLHEYRHGGNIELAKGVVLRVWEMMDRGDEGSWDWEGVMARLDLDFLIA